MKKQYLAVWGSIGLIVILFLMSQTSLAGNIRSVLNADACGGLLQEAEHGQLFGEMTIGDDGKASGGKFVFTPDQVAWSNSADGNGNRVEFCVEVPHAGDYQLRTWVFARDDGHDSMFVTVDGAPSAGYLWDALISDHFAEDRVNNRGASDPQTISLSAGAHTIAFSNRESGTKLDRFELVSLGGPPPAPTASGEENSCGGLEQEAESATLFGNMLVGGDERASGGAFIYIPKEHGNSLDGPDANHRADFCVDITQPGDYQIMGWAHAGGPESDSFFVTLDGGPAAGYLWDPKQSDQFTEDWVNDRGKNDVQLVNLGQGKHTLSIYNREPDTRLDKIKFVLVNAGGPSVNPTESPTQAPVVPTATAAPAATTAPLACGGMLQEAESATLHGGMTIGNDGGASGGQFIFMPLEYGKALRGINLAHRADFCMTVAEAGEYKLITRVKAPDKEQDSFYVTVDGSPGSGILWDIKSSNSFINDDVENRGSKGDQLFQLTPGEHIISFYHREAGALLDRVELVQLSSGGEPEPTVIPTEVPTEIAPTAVPPTAIPPTATTTVAVEPTAAATEIACGGLAHEAEDGTFFGGMQIGTDSKASGSKFVYAPSSVPQEGAKANMANRVDYCVTVTVPGDYQMIGRVNARDGGRDSFFIVVDGNVAESYLWDVAHSRQFIDDEVNNRRKADPQILSLAAGQHTISVVHREANTKLDKFELVQVGEGAPIEPTAIPPTNVPTQEPTQAPTQAPTATPTDEPQPITSLCGDLFQEAESAELFGGMTVGFDSKASGGRFIFVPKSLGASASIEWTNRADFCVAIPEDGDYQIQADVQAADSGTDSFFVTVDSAPAAGYLWDVRHSKNFVTDFVNDRQKSDPQTIFLTAGNHIVSVHNREPGTKLDSLMLTQVSSGGDVVDPPATQAPTATPIPPTATPTSAPTQTPTTVPVTPAPTEEAPDPVTSVCGGLAQEAELATLFGAMTIGFDGKASGGRFVFTPKSVGNQATADPTNRIDFCVTVAEAGDYQIGTLVQAEDGGSDSFFVKVDGSPSAGYLWDVTRNGNFVPDLVNDRQKSDPQIVFLTAGEHTISIFNREPGAKLDKIELIPLSAGGGVIPPQPTVAPPQPTVTPPVSNHPVAPLSSMVDSNTHLGYSNAGLSGGIPDYPNTIVVSGFSESAIEKAINDAKPYTKIILPPGVYNIGTLDIRKSNIALVGGGGACGETILRFGSQDSGIYVNDGGYIGSSVSLTSTANRNSKTIKVSSASGFNVGDYVFIRQDDDSSLFRADLSRNPSEDWVKGNATQFNKIVAKSGNTLTLEGGLNLNFKTSLNARVAKVNNMVTGVGVENLTIERTVDDSAETQSANIFFGYAANSWVKGVHSKNAVRAHIFMYRSYKGEIRGNYLDASYNNGSGGHGYGVRLQNGTTDVLIENNIARLMRHSFIAQLGGNGNVFGYNYSADPYGESLGEIYADLSVHGGFGFSNLFEGNQAQSAKIDNIHASNSGNLFFRNRLEQDINNYTYRSQLLPKGESTPHIWVHENQYFNAFLANEISFPGANSATQTEGFDSGRVRENFTVCKYETSSSGERGCGRTRETTVNHGNHDYLQNTTLWDSSISARGFPVSAYLSSRPSFWGGSAWPSFGPDTLGLSESQKQIPAKTRFINAAQGGGSFCHNGG